MLQTKNRPNDGVQGEWKLSGLEVQLATHVEESEGMLVRMGVLEDAQFLVANDEAIDRIADLSRKAKNGRVALVGDSA